MHKIFYIDIYIFNIVYDRSLVLRRNASSGLPKYSSVAGIGMSYALPIMVIFGGLMALTFTINPFR